MTESVSTIAHRVWRGTRRLGRLLIQSGKDLLTDDGPQWAAAVAYYALLSVFPLLLSGASIAALFVDQDWAIGRLTEAVGPFLPSGESYIDRTVRGAVEARGPAGLLSTLLLLISGSRVFGTLTRALNIAFDVDTNYSFWKRWLVELGMVLTLGLMFLAALISGPALALVSKLTHLPVELSGAAFWILRWLAPPVLLALSLTLCYRFVPRKRPDWTAAAGGGCLAALLLTLAQPLFGYYLREFAGYNLIYGALSAGIALLVWAWIGAVIVLFGGEVASHMQMMWLEGQSARQVQDRHEQRSPRRSHASRWSTGAASARRKRMQA